MTHRRTTEKVCVEPERDLVLKLDDDFVLAAVGDIVPAKAITQRRDPGLKAIGDLLRSADAAFGNMEATIRPVETAFDGCHMWEGPFLTQAPPDVAEDLRKLGFDIMQFGSNRTQDWGIEGQRFSLKALRDAGIAVAGSGENLAEARGAAFAETPGGTVGLVSVTSALSRLGLNGIASALRGKSRGRPGLSVLRATPVVRVSAELFRTLQQMVTTHRYAFPGEFHVSVNYRPISETRFFLDNRIYEIGDTPAYLHDMDRRDLAEVMQSIRNAKIRANLVIAAIHYHQWTVAPDAGQPGAVTQTDDVPQMIRDFAREAIGNGADVVLCHGPGDVKGVEIIDGKPALYGLGNFIRNPYVQNVVPMETFTAQNNPNRPSFDPSDLSITENEIATQVMPVHPRSFFESVLARITFSPAGLRRVVLHPIDLGFDRAIADIGIPRPATGALARDILERIRDRSAGFGTRVEISGDTAVIGAV